MVELLKPVGCRLVLTGLIFKMSDHPDCGVKRWDVDGAVPSTLRINFNYRLGPVANAQLRAYPNGDLWCEAEVVTGDVDFTQNNALLHLRVCDAWSVGYSLSDDGTADNVTPSLIQLPARRAGTPAPSPAPARWELAARVPRVMLVEFISPEVAAHLTAAPETFEMGLSCHGDLVPMGPGVAPISDDAAVRMVHEERRLRRGRR